MAQGVDWAELAALLDVHVDARQIDAALCAADGDITRTARQLFPMLPTEALQELLWAIGERARRAC